MSHDAENLRRAPQGMFRVISYDQYDHEDYVFGDYATAKQAISIARQQAAHVNASPPTFSNIYLVYNDQGECLEAADYGWCLVKPFSSLNLTLSFLFVCFLGLITDPSSTGLIFGSALVILKILWAYLKTYLKTRRDRTLRILSQTYILVLCAHLFLISTLIFDYFNIQITDSLPDSATGMLAGAVVSFLILSAYFFQRKYRYHNATVFFLIAASLCLSFGAFYFCDDNSLRLFSLPVDETGFLFGTILPLGFIAVYLKLSYKKLGAGALSIVLVLFHIFFILVMAMLFVTIEFLFTDKSILWFTGLLLGAFLSISLLICHYRRLDPKNEHLPRLLILCGIGFGLAVIIHSVMNILQKNNLYPFGIEDRDFGFYFGICLSSLLVLAYILKDRKKIIQGTRYFVSEFWHKNIAGQCREVMEGIIRVFILGCMFSAYVTIAVFSHYDLGPSYFLQYLNEKHILKMPTPYFLHFLMRDQYLWYQHIPQLFSTIPHDTPKQVFEDLIYKEKDKWSFVQKKQEDHDFYKNARFLDYGMELKKGDKRKIRVGYVYPRSSAGENGILRGYHLLGIDGHTIEDFLNKKATWYAIFNKENKQFHDFQFMDADGNKIQKTLELTATHIEAAPIHRIIEQQGQKIGYLLFLDFLDIFYDDLQKTLKEFKKENITELVLDLRYNPGGKLESAANLGCLIGGEQVHGKIFLKPTFNDKYTDMNREIYFPSHLKIFMDRKKYETLGLKRLFVITSESSASASECLIIGLKPYMPVIVIGSRTSGKPVGLNGYTYGEHTFYIVTCYGANALGEKVPEDGICPDCEAADDLDHPLGDIEEESLKTALHYIAHNTCPEKHNQPDTEETKIFAID